MMYIFTLSAIATTFLLSWPSLAGKKDTTSDDYKTPPKKTTSYNETNPLDWAPKKPCAAMTQESSVIINTLLSFSDPEDEDPSALTAALKNLNLAKTKPINRNKKK